MNLGTSLQAARAGLVAFEGVLVANAADIGNPYRWMIGGAVAIGIAVVSELIAGMNARLAIKSEVNRDNTLASRPEEGTDGKINYPWWWGIV